MPLMDIEKEKSILYKYWRRKVIAIGHSDKPLCVLSIRHFKKNIMFSFNCLSFLAVCFFFFTYQVKYEVQGILNVKKLFV